MIRIGKIFSIIFLGFFIYQTAAPAADGNRNKNPFGIFAQALSGPFYMGGLGWNLGDLARLHGAYGKKSEEVTVGTTTASTDVSSIILGIKFFVPSWNFSPFAGVDYVRGDGTVTIGGLSYKASRY